MNLLFESLPQDKCIFLASDFHLGSPDYKSSRARETRIVGWLNQIMPKCSGLILAGDLFDFWFEYKRVVPKGFARLIGKLAEMSDSGIPIVLFTGNHDLWLKDYFIQELSASVFHNPESFRVGRLNLHIGHGDGLGPGDRVFKFNKSIFTNPLAQWGFRWLHPDIGMTLAQKWSESSRIKGLEKPDPFLGEQEWILQYCRALESNQHHDYYLFGHRHLILEMKVGENSTYLNAGAWIDQEPHYIQIDGDSARIKEYTQNLP